MALSCGYKCLQVLLIVMNIIVLVCSITLIVVGSMAESNFNKYGGAEQNNLRAFVIFVIVLGCYLTVVGILGFCGACKKNVYCLTVYTILVVIFILAGIGAGIAGFVLKEKVTDSVNELMNQAYKRYQTDNDYKKLIDAMQSELDCCGPDGTWPTDQGPKPASCTSDGKDHTQGCNQAVKDFFKKYMAIVAGCVFGFALLHILGAVFAICIIQELKKEGSA